MLLSTHSPEHHHPGKNVEVIEVGVLVSAAALVILGPVFHNGELFVCPVGVREVPKAIGSPLFCKPRLSSVLSFRTSFQTRVEPIQGAIKMFTGCDATVPSRESIYIGSCPPSYHHRTKGFARGVRDGAGSIDKVMVTVSKIKTVAVGAWAVSTSEH